jgi:hypothetical protein
MNAPPPFGGNNKSKLQADSASGHGQYHPQFAAPAFSS